MRGTRVEPGIYRRPQGGYLVRLVRHGEEFTRVLDRLEDARRLKRERLLARAGMILPGPRVSLKAILDTYADELEAQGGTDVPRLRRLNTRILGFFGEHKPAPLGKDDLLALRKWVLTDTKENSSGERATAALYWMACLPGHVPAAVNRTQSAPPNRSAMVQCGRISLRAGTVI